MAMAGTQELPWGYWLAFGMVYGAVFGCLASGLVRHWQQAKQMKREEEQRERMWLAEGAGRRIDTRENLPVSLAMREAYERGRREGRVLAQIDEHTRDLRSLKDRVQEIEAQLGQTGA